MRAGRAEEPFRTAFEAIRGDDRAALAAVLSAHPGLVDARGTNGNRLLMLAISMNRLVLAGDLLDAGADPNLANDKGWGPLHDIAYGGGRGDREARLALLDRLIAAGGLVEAEAYGDGGTPWRWRCSGATARWPSGWRRRWWRRSTCASPPASAGWT